MSEPVVNPRSRSAGQFSRRQLSIDRTVTPRSVSGPLFRVNVSCETRPRSRSGRWVPAPRSGLARGGWRVQGV